MNYSEQWQLIKNDKWLLACLTWVPVVLAFSIWLIFSQGIARNIPIAVVDLEQSQLSRNLIHHYQASPALSVNRYFQDATQAKNALTAGDVYAYIVIPKGFEKSIYLGVNHGNAPQVSVFYNSQYILIGKLVSTAIQQAQGTFNAQIDVLKSLAGGNTTTTSALGKAVNVRSQSTALFNKNTHYNQFLLSAIVPAIWQMLIVVATVMILSMNLRNQGLQKWLNRSPIINTVKTLACYSPIFLLQGIVFLLWFYQGMKWPMNGSFSVIILAQCVTIMTCMVMGSLFFFLTMDPARAMSFAGAFTAPSFAFMGITFPVTDMNFLAQFWRNLLPISHYIEVQVSQVSYGLSALSSLSHLLPMLGYILPLLLTCKLIKDQTNKMNMLSVAEPEHRDSLQHDMKGES